MTNLTTTDVNEYQTIPATLRRLRDQRNYLLFIKDFVGADSTLDDMITLRRRRKQLRRQGAY